MSWQGYFRVKRNDGLPEGLADDPDVIGECCGTEVHELLAYRKSVDNKEGIIKGKFNIVPTLEKANTLVDIMFDELVVFNSVDECRQYILDNKENWEIEE